MNDITRTSTDLFCCDRYQNLVCNGACKAPLPSKEHVHSWHLGQCTRCLLEQIEGLVRDCNDKDITIERLRADNEHYKQRVAALEQRPKFQVGDQVKGVGGFEARTVMGRQMAYTVTLTSGREGTTEMYEEELELVARASQPPGDGWDANGSPVTE